MSGLGIALLALVVLLLAAAVYVAGAEVARLLRHDGTLRLPRALELQGGVLPDPATPLLAQALGLATRRCMLCARQAKCDELLAAGDTRAMRDICPNSAYLDSLRPG